MKNLNSSLPYKSINTIDNFKYKEYDIVSGIKIPNYNNPKTHKIGSKISL